VAIGKPIRPAGHFALLSGQGDRDALENRQSQVSSAQETRLTPIGREPAIMDFTDC
jgi:hypothetical protein